ncbi:MAG: hypothetical protein H6736_19035 [Alphaproteobacteria bacterium]|nr:hypothetical protein [Alphaproteobacteria bacterium]
MDITRKTRLMNIVSNEEMRDILEWYGLPTHDPHYFRLTLEDFCNAHDVDVEDVLLELAAGAEGDEEEEDEDWLYEEEADEAAP